MTTALSIDAPHTAESAEGGRLTMTEVQFKEFYSKTARPLKSYLSRITGSQTLAEDMLQESYYRLLRSNLPDLDDTQLKNYLYRTATNLARDHFRQSKFHPVPLEDHASPSRPDHALETSSAVRQALGGIKQNERELVWLAYVEGASHREIAAITGLKEASIRPLLFRVRKKLAALLRPQEED